MSIHLLTVKDLDFPVNGVYLQEFYMNLGQWFVALGLETYRMSGTYFITILLHFVYFNTKLNEWTIILKLSGLHILSLQESPVVQMCGNMVKALVKVSSYSMS